MRTVFLIAVLLVCGVVDLLAQPPDPVIRRGATPEQQQQFQTGLALFRQFFQADQYNRRRCSECHNRPVIAGGGHRYLGVTVFGHLDSQGTFDPLTAYGGPILRERHRPGQSQDLIPSLANVRSFRTVPPLFGLGLVAAIDPGDILLAHDPDDSDSDGISGKALATENEINRFGSQLQSVSLEAFTANAFCHEMGQCGMSQADIDAVATFLSLIAPPSEQPGFQVASHPEGETYFATLGCASCHTPLYNLSDPAYPTIQPYSDFVLHDMGPLHDDGVALGSEQGGASGEYRTAPLWGAQFRIANPGFMHNGMAQSVHNAIVMHGGEAAASRDAYLELDQAERDKLLDFVESR